MNIKIYIIICSLLVIAGLSIGVMILSPQPSLASPSLQATLTSTPLPTVPPEEEENYRTIESDDRLVLQEGEWTEMDTEAASGGSYLYSGGTSQADVLSVAFEGTFLDVTYVTHPSFGTMAIEVDGVVLRTVWTGESEVEFGVRSVISYLDFGPHIVRIYPVDGTIGIDSFYAGGSFLELNDLEVYHIATAKPFSMDIDVSVYIHLPQDEEDAVVNMLIIDELIDGVVCAEEQTSFEAISPTEDLHHNIVHQKNLLCTGEELKTVYSTFLEAEQGVRFTYTLTRDDETIALTDLPTNFSIFAAASQPEATPEQ